MIFIGPLMKPQKAIEEYDGDLEECDNKLVE